MSKYEFTFVVTDVELSKDQREKVARAVTLAGTAALGDSLPADFATARIAAEDEYLVRHWCGIPKITDFPGRV